MFENLVERRTSMNDRLQAKNLIESGKRYQNEQDGDNFRQVNGRLWDLLPQREQQSEEMRHFTGIV